MSMKSVLMAMAVLAGMVGAVGLAPAATTYELTVASGETMALDVAMAAAYPSATLAAEDVIVKKGEGTLTDSAEALALDGSLRFEICEGALVEGVARLGSTYCVSNGAAVECSISLTNISTADAPALFVLCGAGTSDRPGALYLSQSSGSANQRINYELTGDTVIRAIETVNFSSTTTNSTTINKFTMHGHALRFVNAKTSNYFRFRHAVSFIEPGEITFDTCGMTRLNTANVYVKTAGGKATTIPRVKLVNGARFNCVNEKLSQQIDILDCEAGTQLCKVGSDAPGDYAVACLVGAPTISADQKVTVESYRARATDLLDGKCLTSKGSFGFAEGAGVGIEGLETLEKGVNYTLVETTADVTGSATPEFPASIATLTAGATSLTVCRLGDFPPESFVVTVPTGCTYTYAQVAEQYDPALLVDKTLYKIGRGQLTLNVCLTNELGRSALTNLVVAQGVCRLTHSAGLPVQPIDETTAQCVVTVLDGATFKNNVVLTSLSSSSKRVLFNLAGEGTDGLGALCCEVNPGGNVHFVEYHLDGDTTITKSCGACTLSSGYNADNTKNIFYMNGYDLTFKNAPEESDGYFRFRYCVTFDTPGTITFDGCGVTHLKGAQVRDRVSGTTQPLPLVRLVNGAKINCVDQLFASAIGVLECEPGTEICGVNQGSEPGKTSFDWPTDYTLSCVKGFPTITQLEWNGVWQKISIENLIVKAADVNAGKSLTATPTLNFAADATVDIDDFAALAPLPDEGVLLASGTEELTGSVTKGPSLKGKFLRLKQKESSLWLRRGFGFGLVFR